MDQAPPQDDDRPAEGAETSAGVLAAPRAHQGTDAAPGGADPGGAPDELPDAGAPAPVPWTRRWRSRDFLLRASAVAAIFFGAGLLTWFLVRHGGDDAAPPASPEAAAVVASGPALVDQDALRTAQAQLGHFVYWAGPATGRLRYELTVASDGTATVRYVPPTLKPGTSPGAYRAVITYPRADALAEVETGARRSGATVARYTAGAVAVSPPGNRTSTFFAFPGVPLLVEVYDPAPGKAWTLVRSGAVQQIS